MEGVDLGECRPEGVDARVGGQGLRSYQVRDRPVVLPEADEPEQAAVREKVESSPGAVRYRDREPELSDLEDSAARSATNGLR
jgi:hypothetical protein